MAEAIDRSRNTGLARTSAPNASSPIPACSVTSLHPNRETPRWASRTAVPESLSVISSRPAATQLRNCRRSARARGRSESTMAATNTSRTGYASCTAWPRGLQRPVAASGWSTANQLAKKSEEAATAPSASIRAVPPEEPALVGTSQTPYAASGPHVSVTTSPTEGLGIDPATATYPRAQAPSAAARNRRGRRIARRLRSRVRRRGRVYPESLGRRRGHADVGSAGRVRRLAGAHQSGLRRGVGPYARGRGRGGLVA